MHHRGADLAQEAQDAREMVLQRRQRTTLDGDDPPAAMAARARCQRPGGQGQGRQQERGQEQREPARGPRGRGPGVIGRAPRAGPAPGARPDLHPGSGSSLILVRRPGWGYYRTGVRVGVRGRLHIACSADLGVGCADREAL